MPVDLYGLKASPPTRAVLMLGKEIGLEINLKIVDLFQQEHLKPEFLKMNPTHTVPTMDDNGYYLWESRPIMIYLYTKYGKDDSLYPRDPQKRGLIDQMFYFDATSLFPAVADNLHGPLLKGIVPTKESCDKMKEKLEMFNIIMEGKTFAIGDTMTLADLSLGVTASTYELTGVDLKSYPNVNAWMDRIKKLSYFKEACQDGGDILKEVYNSKISQLQ